MTDGPGRAEEVRAAEQERVAGESGVAAPVPFGQTWASVLLDLLRGLAALVVLLDHWRNALFVDFAQLPAHRKLAAVPYLVTSAGHQAVVVFFVLSGFLIGGTIFRAMERNQWSWRQYLLHRLVRLWIVLAPGLLLCELWDRLGIWLGRAPLLYAGAGYNNLTLPVLPRLGLRVFVGNLFFVGGLHVPTLGSDGPLWSLAFEFWYYLLFPAILLAVLARRWPSRLVFLVLAGGTAWIAGREVLMSFPVWLLGAALAAARRLPTVPVPLRWVIIVVYVPVFFAISKVHALPGIDADYLLGLLTAALLVTLLSFRARAKEGGRLARVSRATAGFSFTLYVVHLPFLLLCMSLVAGDRRWPLTAWTITKALVLLAVTLGYASLVAEATELRTATVRRWVEGRFPVLTA